MGRTDHSRGRGCARCVEDACPWCRQIIVERTEVGPTAASDSNLGKRATELLGRALGSDDAESEGLLADDVLADPELALKLLGSPSHLAGARNAVVQHYGRVGALLVVGYEERFARRQSAGCEPEISTAPGAGRCVEQLVVDFATLDAGEIDDLLAELDACEGRAIDAEAISARRWLHATYAVAGRDGSDTAHRAYMAALGGVMQLTRSQVAS
jgi:hypothetical protein